MKKTKSTFGYSIIFMMLLFMPSGHLASQEILTLGEIYDYEVGDVFHYYKWGQNYGRTKGGMWSVTNISILDRYYSADEDTLFYVRDVDYQVVYSPDPNPEYAFYTDTVYYTCLNSLLNSGDVDSVFFDPERYQGRAINFVDFSDYYSIYTEEFAAGCGKVTAHYYSETYNTESEDNLVYYKKGEEEWGSEIIVSVKEPESNGLEPAIFPNPANQSVHILTNDHTYGEATLFALNGKIIATYELSPALSALDISDLSPGLYIFEIRVNDKFYHKKLVIE